MSQHTRPADAAVTQATETLVALVEARRQQVSRSLEAKTRTQLGQYFTPRPVADFLAAQLTLPQLGDFRVLDPGAGVGSLTASLVARVLRERSALALTIVAFEIDEALVPHLRQTLEDCRRVAGVLGVALSYEIREEDFVQWGAQAIEGSLLATPLSFHACIMNPPYRKIGAGRQERLAVARLGLRVTNLYAAFLALVADLLEPGGQVSAITPRSFSNGLYFDPFRKYFFSRMALDRVHVYERRGELFADAEVLQENVVFCATRDGARREVALSVVGSSGEHTERAVPYQEILRPDDPHQFIRLPVDARDSVVAQCMGGLEADLLLLDLKVSTGRVVDFRTRENLRDDHGGDTVALIYPGHLKDGRVRWPASDSKKPNALRLTSATQGLVLPNETYVLVKRFTAKEETRRVVAALASHRDIEGDAVAFENHLNVYHRDGRGLPGDLAAGLVAFLNSTIVDQFVRQFNGHTQINATDLRQLPYPRADELRVLGRALVAHEGWPSQDELDGIVAEWIEPFALETGHVVIEVGDDVAA